MKFLEAQGYKMKASILYQDNESAIKLIRNGKASSSRRTRHFDIKYFNMRDKMQLNWIEVVYCPTEKMVADFFTKPLQGSLFRMMRRIVMGMDPISILNLSKIPGIPTKERVGEAIQATQNNAGKPKKTMAKSYADVVRTATA